MNRRNIIISSIVIVILAAGAFIFVGQSSTTTTNTTNLQTAQIERGSLAAAVNAAGTITTPQEATLIRQAAGRVGKVNVAVGQTVSAGDVLMELDPASLDHTFLQAQADLLTAQADLDTLLAGPTAQQIAQAKVNVVQAQQAATTAERNLTSVMNPLGQSLYDSVTAAQLAFDTAQANSTLEHVSADASAIQTTENTMNAAYSVLQRAQNNLDDCIKNNCAEQPQRENALTTAQNNYQTALNNYQAAKLQYDTKVNNLTYNVDTSKQALDKAKANLTAAQAGPDPVRVALYQAQLDLAKGNLKQAQDDLAKLQTQPLPQDVAQARAKVANAQALVDTANLIAPFRGTVMAVYNNVGDNISNATTAVVIADISSLEIKVNVAEVDVNSIAISQDVTVTADAAPGLTFNGKVSAILNIGTSQQGVVTFPVTVVIPKPDPALKSGMTAAVAIVTDRRENVLTVPNRAIQVAGGQRTVTVLFEGQQIPVPITLGLTSDTASEIVDGQVREGDTVVLNATTTTATNRNGGFPLFGLFGGGGGRGGP